jgi:hypothetical protein
MKNPPKWQRAELLIFSILTVLNMLPFIATRFFPSMDGASHLSNVNIINQLVFHNNSLFHQFFQINPEPVPNWTSNLLISLLTLIMPAFLAEKILVIILLTGVPFAFRILMTSVAPGRTIYSFLIFPFTHTMFLFFGFFNFCMAVLLFLVTLNYWLQNENKPWNLKRGLTLALLVASTYFSHVVIFGTLLIIIAAHIITRTVIAAFDNPAEGKAIIRKFLVKTMAISLSAVIPLMLFIYFFYSRPGTREINFINRHELIKFLVTVRPLISFNPDVEGKHTTILFYLLAGLIATGSVFFIYRLALKLLHKNPTGTNQEQKLAPGVAFWWLLSSMAMLLILYFKLPDAYGTASYTSLRIAFIFFLLVILWISTFRIPWYFGLLAAITGLYVNTMLVRYYSSSIRDLGKLAVACNKAADFVAPNSLILPVYCMDNWFTGHFVDYIAVDKPVVMVYNYECQSGYFPVIWNEKTKPNYYLGNPAIPDRYINFELVKGRPSLMLDYVFVVGQFNPEKDWFFSTLHKILTEDFTKVYVAPSCTLYRNKLAVTR